MPVEVIADESCRPNGLSRLTCERLVFHMLGVGILSDDFHFTAFSVVHYVVTGARAHALETGRLDVSLEIPTSEAKASGMAAVRGGNAGENGSAGRGIVDVDGDGDGDGDRDADESKRKRKSAAKKIAAVKSSHGASTKPPSSSRLGKRPLRDGQGGIEGVDGVVDLCDSDDEQDGPGRGAGARLETSHAEGSDLDEDGDMDIELDFRKKRNKKAPKRGKKIPVLCDDNMDT